MVVEGIDRKLPQRDDDACLVEGFNNQVGVYPGHLAGIN